MVTQTARKKKRRLKLKRKKSLQDTVSEAIRACLEEE
jgi:hypothetical protein